MASALRRITFVATSNAMLHDLSNMDRITQLQDEIQQVCVCVCDRLSRIKNKRGASAPHYHVQQYRVFDRAIHFCASQP